MTQAMTGQAKAGSGPKDDDFGFEGAAAVLHLRCLGILHGQASRAPLSPRACMRPPACHDLHR